MKAILVALIFVISMAVTSPAMACSTYQACRAAAQQGDANAQNYLGFMYREGMGVGKNETEAMRWFRLAAEQGNVRAQRNLVRLEQRITRETSVRESDAAAVRSYRLAAEQGDAVAQNNLGLMYQHGMGVDKNETEAMRWFRRAAEQGNARAKQNLDRLEQGTQRETRERVARERAAREREERAARELASQEAALAQQAQQLRQVCLSFGIADESAELRECVQRLYIESVRQSQRTADAEREQRQRLEHSQRQSAMAEQAREDRCRLASSMYTSCYGSCLATTAGGFLYASNQCVQQCRPEALERTRACQ